MRKSKLAEAQDALLSAATEAVERMKRVPGIPSSHWFVQLRDALTKVAELRDHAPSAAPRQTANGQGTFKHVDSVTYLSATGQPILVFEAVPPVDGLRYFYEENGAVWGVNDLEKLGEGNAPQGLVYSDIEDLSDERAYTWPPKNAHLQARVRSVYVTSVHTFDHERAQKANIVVCLDGNGVFQVVKNRDWDHG